MIEWIVQRKKLNPDPPPKKKQKTKKRVKNKYLFFI